MDKVSCQEFVRRMTLLDKLQKRTGWEVMDCVRWLQSNNFPTDIPLKRDLEKTNSKSTIE